MAGSPRPGARDPRDLPDQLRLRRPRDPREVARRADAGAARGDQLGARGVVLHAGSAKTGDVDEAIARAGEVIREALAESDSCPLHLENTAGAGGTLGPLVPRARGAVRGRRRRRAPRAVPGLLPPYASGFDVRTAEGLTRRSTSASSSSAPTGSVRCTSTTRGRRWGRTSTATPRWGRASSARRAVRCSSPSRASRTCR